jgi:hypothetical protein
MIPQNKNVHQLVWHLWYIDTAVESSELYCYNTEGSKNSVVSQTLCRMDVTRLEQHAYIKIAVVQGRNARKCHNELVESMGNNALPITSLQHSLAFLPRSMVILM